jgi:pyrroloquinoline-quinone synthase
MDVETLERELTDAALSFDLLSHPFYRAWSEGALSTNDLRAYAAQYEHQVGALPNLLRAAISTSTDPATRSALQRNLDEEEGRAGPAHLLLWRRFADALGGASGEQPRAETRESAAALQALVETGPVEALAALWAYEMQTARVARTKREGLAERYGIDDQHAVAFFELHEQLDLVHAKELLAALHRACSANPALCTRASEAARNSAKSQWHFLDGAERQRAGPGAA